MQQLPSNLHTYFAEVIKLPATAGSLLVSVCPMPCSIDPYPSISDRSKDWILAHGSNRP